MEPLKLFLIHTAEFLHDTKKSNCLNFDLKDKADKLTAELKEIGNYVDEMDMKQWTKST